MRAELTSLFTRGCAAAVVSWIALAASGCVNSLDVPEVRDPTQPNVTYRYGAMRSEARMFADYSVVDTSILADANAASPQPEPRP